MASHKTVTTHRASKKTITAARTAVTLATATVGSIALVPGLAQADPNANLNDVQKKVKDLQNQAEIATEQYDKAASDLATLQHKVDQLQARITQEQGELGTAQTALGSLAAAQYKAGGMDATMQLMLATSPDTFLQQATAANEISNRSADSVKNAQEIQRQLQQDKATAAADLAQLQKTRDLMAANLADIKAKEKAAQDLLNSLTPTQRVQYNNIQRQQTQTNLQTPTDLPTAPNARAALAVAFAKAQLGKPYVYGGVGPYGFDCSGLMLAAWAKAGVSMDHGSVSQAYAFPRVSLKDLQPGDLLLYYGSLHHVGMYVGGGKIIHAPYTGTVVQYADMNSMPLMWAVRP